MTLDAAGEFQLEEEGGDGRGRQLALAHQFVNRDRRRTQSFEDQFGPVLVTHRFDDPRPW